MDITVNLYVHPSQEVRDWMATVTRKLDLIISKENQIMATLDQVLSEVTDESTQLDSLSALIDGLKQQIKDALSGATLPPATQAKIDAVFAGVETNKAKVQAALNANTPAAPVNPTAQG